MFGGLHSASWAMIAPAGQAAVAKAAPPGQAAEAQGLVEACGLVAASAGAYIAAPIYDWAGPEFLYGVTAAALAVMPLTVFGLRSRWRSVF